MALTAFLGAGSASATVLCKTSLTEGCAAANWDYSSGTTIDATIDESVNLSAGFAQITCTQGTVHGFTSNTGGGSSTTTVTGNATATFVLNSCTPECTKIEVTEGTLEIHHISGTDNGTLTASGFTAVLTCSGITCKYITGNNLDMGTLTGSTASRPNATMDIDANLTKEEGSSFLCNGSATWKGSYWITSPTPLYIATS